MQSYSGHTYQLQRRDTLLSGTWDKVGEAQAGNNGVLTFTDPGGASQSQGFYRVVVE